MKSNGMFLALALALFTVAASAQTPPPNDNYANRTLLTGTDITFSGTLVGATIEDTNEADYFVFYPYPRYPITKSVWWTWTAPVSTSLTIQYSGPSGGTTDDPLSELNIYSATDGATSPDGLILPALSSMFLIPSTYFAPVFRPQSLSLPVIAGTSYQIQLIGQDPLNFTFRLVATNTPVIIQQPVSQTVYSNASVTFYSVYAGTDQGDFGFQWQFNGTNLSDETTPIIALTNIDSTMAGAYTLIVGNDNGLTVSQPAILTVSQSNYPATLALAGYQTNFLSFNLNGENGRLYRLYTSSNLLVWNPAYQVPGTPRGLYGGSVIFNSNSPLPITVSNNSTQMFFRMGPYLTSTPEAEICINNLRQIYIARFLWLRDHGQDATDLPNDAQVQPYFPHHAFPLCPNDTQQTYDTSYTVYSDSPIPICNVVQTNHVLEEFH